MKNTAYVNPLKLVVMTLVQVLKLARPHQYVKNLFIFMPVFFAGQVMNTEHMFLAFIAFVAFCCAASAIYILNDYRDVEEDKKHPSKKNRPLASGAIPLKSAWFLMAIFGFTGIAVLMKYSLPALAILMVYVALNIAYSFRLKHVAILDVTIISIGFILRIFIGAIITGIPLSQWIVIMTFLLAMFLALAKRRDDVLIYLETKQKMRKVINDYNLKFIEGAMMIMASVTIVAYVLYTTSQEVVIRLQSDYVYLSSFFVILGILRYLQITLVENKSGSPTKMVLKDLFLKLTIVGWISHFIFLLYT